LNSVKHRSNLTILTDQFVDRIVVENRHATGVEVQGAQAPRHLSARREVLLCAGAYGSPAVLMHSGVGDGAALAALGIDTVHHLPEVGRNLRDHPSAEVRMRTDSITPYGLTWRALPRNTYNLIEYLMFRTGPISGNVFEATGFTRSRPDLRRPDLQLAFMPAARSARPLPLEHGYGIISIAVRPKSRGSVTLSSPDARLPPVIDPNYLDHPDDIATIRFGLELGRRILAAKPFETYRGEELVPGRTVQEAAELDAYIRQTAAGVHHPSSTCRMGSDDGAVVDAALRVRGMSGLRVIDASIFPTLVAGNTNAAVVMVAEKAADMILGRPAPAPLEVASAP
jgi:choline dehydrogenase-like flavoprotein